MKNILLKIYRLAVSDTASLSLAEKARSALAVFIAILAIIFVSSLFVSGKGEGQLFEPLSSFPFVHCP